MIRLSRHIISIFLSCFFLVVLVSTSNTFAKSPSNTSPHNKLGNDDSTFTFTGLCPNGETYRIFSYQKAVESALESFYDYDGPVGKGTVRSSASPKTMSVRVCRKLAEIVNSRYWE